jgi:hypothetical protein
LVLHSSRLWPGVLASTSGALLSCIASQVCVFGEWLDSLNWLSVRWEKRKAQVKTLPGAAGANNDDTLGCHSPSWRCH